MKRVFVRGMSRSGGTLMVTILDAHPQIAMGYELYEKLLEPLDEQAAGISAKPGLFDRAVKPHKIVSTLAYRASRSGVDEAAFDALVREHIALGSGFGTFGDRMRFVEKIVQHKLFHEGKRHWGTKIASGYHELLETFPAEECYFLFMQRDGRDVAASQKHVGSFNKSAAEVASSWRSQIERFQRFAKEPGVQARLVRYESLTQEPEATLQEIVDFLGVPWSDNLLNYHTLDLSLYRNPCGHLSAKQVSQEINTSSVGRWQKDLDAAEIEDFHREAGDLLRELGYAA